MSFVLRQGQLTDAILVFSDHSQECTWCATAKIKKQKADMDAENAVVRQPTRRADAIASFNFTGSHSANIHFAKGETIHTENSRKFTTNSLAGLLDDAGFQKHRTWTDARSWCALTLAGVC